MIDAGTYLPFIAALLAYQMTPGPDMMLVMSRGIGQGRRIAMCTALGCVSAGFVQLPLLVLAVASLVRSSPLAFDLLRYAGAAYLIYLGLRLVSIRPRPDPAVQPAPSTTLVGAFRQGMLSNLLNPKTLMFMLAFLPQFVDPSAGPATIQLLVLGATMKGTGLVTLGSVALASGAVGDWLSRRPGLLAYQDRFAGAVMVALGLQLFVTGDGGRGAVRA